MRYLFSRPKKIENSKPNPGHILFTIISRCPIHTHKHIENFKRLAFRFSILNVYGNKFHRFFLATFFLWDSHEWHHTHIAIFQICQCVCDTNNYLNQTEWESKKKSSSFKWWKQKFCPGVFISIFMVTVYFFLFGFNIFG